METEAVKIDKGILDQCRAIAREEGRTLVGLMSLLLTYGLAQHRVAMHGYDAQIEKPHRFSNTKRQREATAKGD